MCWQFSRHARLSSAYYSVDWSARSRYAEFMLLLSFLMHNLFKEEVEEYSSKNPFDPIGDPSQADECIGIVLLLIDWYLLIVIDFYSADVTVFSLRTRLISKICKS